MLDRLRRRRLTPPAFLVALVLTALLVFGYRKLVPPVTVPAELADAAFAREVAVAEALSLRVTQDRRVTTEEPYVHRRIAVPAGSCIAVVASASGGGQLRYLHLSRGSDTVATDESLQGLAAHVQTCVEDATNLEMSLYAEQQDGFFGRPLFSRVELHFAVLIGQPPGGMMDLNRGTVTHTREVPQSDILHDAEAWAGDRTPYGPPLSVGAFRARLVPERTASYDALRALAVNSQTVSRTLSPTIDRLPANARDLWGTLPADYEVPADGVATPAMAFQGGSTPVRVLAVVDADALERCVEVLLVRMAWGAPTTARRLHAAVPEREENFMTDRVCEGRVVYVTDANDQTPYRMRLFEAEHPDGGAASPDAASLDAGVADGGVADGRVADDG